MLKCVIINCFSNIFWFVPVLQIWWNLHLPCLLPPSAYFWSHNVHASIRDQDRHVRCALEGPYKGLGGRFLLGLFACRARCSRSAGSAEDSFDRVCPCSPPGKWRGAHGVRSRGRSLRVGSGVSMRGPRPCQAVPASTPPPAAIGVAWEKPFTCGGWWIA